MSVITVSEVKDLLNITTTADDGAVVDVITRAEAALAGKVGRLEPTVVVEWLPSDGGGQRLVLAWAHAATLVSVTPVGGAPIPVGDLYVQGGLIESNSGTPFAGLITPVFA